MADFVGAADRQIYRWTAGDSHPRGIQLIKVRFWLASQDYQVEELVDLGEEIYLLSSLLAFGAIDFDQVHDVLNYSHQDSSIALLHGTHAPSGQRSSEIARLIDGLINDPDQQMQNWYHWLKCFHQPLIVWPDSAATEQVAAEVSSGNNHQVILQSLKSIIEAATPLAELVLSDAFSQEERRALRESFEKDGLFVFSNTLSALCSARAREEAIKEKRRTR